jgi:hypothetical protein
MIGSLQWAVSLGRFDIQTATMTMSRFRASPRQGHLDQLKWMYGYLRRYASAVIHVQLKNLISVSFLIKNLIGVKKYMARWKNCYQQMHQNLLERQQQQFITQMQIFSMIC